MAVKIGNKGNENQKKNWKKFIGRWADHSCFLLWKFGEKLDLIEQNSGNNDYV